VVGVREFGWRPATRAPVRGLEVLGSTLLLLVGCSLAGFRLNLTGSLPLGLYRTMPGPLVRGSLVLLCLPPHVAAFARARGYLPRGGGCPGGVLPVGKPVLALPGDTVAVTVSGLRVNGIPVPNSRALATDHGGRRLPRLPLRSQVVGPGTLWVVSAYARTSFDSRYFGPVVLAAVRSYLRPVWTAGPER
jgi:conjugative transfer signal peptidase TraF